MAALAPFLAALEEDDDITLCAVYTDEQDRDAIWFYTVFPDVESRARHQAREAAMTEAIAGLMPLLSAPLDNTNGELTWSVGIASQ